MKSFEIIKINFADLKEELINYLASVRICVIWIS